jgi:phosphatidate cytidylyltransferase
LKQRIISAIIAIVIAIVILYFHKTIIFTLAISAIASIIVFELLRATDSMKNKAMSIVTIAFTFLNIIIYTYFPTYTKLFYAFSALLIFLIFISYHKTVSYVNLFVSVASAILVSTSFLSIVCLNNQRHLIYLIMALCSAWIADSGAYFVGVSIGKHKLSPEISPKKSIEGFIGGVVIDAIILEIIYITVLNKSGVMLNNIIFLIIAILCGVIGTLGDLSASVIKRQNNIKDFGNLMPGHGGALDRFDSVLLVAPFFYVAVTTFNL